MKQPEIENAEELLNRKYTPNHSERLTVREYITYSRNCAAALRFISAIRCHEHGTRDYCKNDECLECFQSEATKAIEGRYKNGQ